MDLQVQELMSLAVLTWLISRIVVPVTPAIETPATEIDVIIVVVPLAADLHHVRPPLRVAIPVQMALVPVDVNSTDFGAEIVTIYLNLEVMHDV